MTLGLMPTHLDDVMKHVKSSHLDSCHLLSNVPRCSDEHETLLNHDSQDSGIDFRDDGDTLFVDDELKDKIVGIIENYFSDENLLKDSFLRKHVTRNRLGFVSVKLVASLR